jgi:hypothetical protein
MVMLIAVGDEWLNLDAAKGHLLKLDEAEQAVFGELFSQVENE